jgi:hypothetical protein
LIVGTYQHNLEISSTALSAMWPHHLQILCLTAWSFGTIVFQKLLDSDLITTPSTAMLLIALFYSIPLTGWQLPVDYRNLTSKVSNPAWQTPAEAVFIKDNFDLFKTNNSFARLGPNDDFALAEYLPNDWRLVCRDYSQYGHESVERVDELTNCLANLPEVVIVSPGFYQLTRQKGTYEDLKQDAKIVLAKHFDCLAVDDRPGAFICLRTVN